MPIMCRKGEIASRFISKISIGHREAMASSNGIQTPDEENTKWRLIGDERELSRLKCHHLHAKSGKKFDVALFYHEGNFYAISAWCSHMGGPLYQGQIEDYKGGCHVMCPWHSYMFDLKTGANDLGLQQEVFKVKTINSKVYIEHDSELSLGSYVINAPTQKR